MRREVGVDESCRGMSWQGREKVNLEMPQSQKRKQKQNKL